MLYFKPNSKVIRWKNFIISANVIGQDESQALDVFDSKTLGIRYLEKKYELNDLEDEFDSLDSTLSEFQDSVIVYIAGFVKRKLQSEVKRLLCTEVIYPVLPAPLQTTT